MSATNVCEGIPYFKIAQQVSKEVSHDIVVRPKAWNYLKFPVRIGRVSKVDFKTNFTMNMSKDKADIVSLRSEQFFVSMISTCMVCIRDLKRGYSRSEMMGLNG